MSKTLYDRAVDVAKGRPSISVTNLKTAIGCSDAQARTFIRVMREDGTLGGQITGLNRWPVVAWRAPEGSELTPFIDLDNPEQSVIAGMTPSEILDERAQMALRKIVDAALELEAKKAEIMEAMKAVYAHAKPQGLSPKIVRKVVSLKFRARVEEFQGETSLTELYLHALGDLAEDLPDGVTVQ